jgi:hypothetical protein
MNLSIMIRLGAVQHQYILSEKSNPAFLFEILGFDCKFASYTHGPWDHDHRPVTTRMAMGMGICVRCMNDIDMPMGFARAVLIKAFFGDR